MSRFSSLSEALEEIDRLNQELSEARQTIEDVACGTAMECVVCGKYMPCLCSINHNQYVPTEPNH